MLKKLNLLGCLICLALASFANAQMIAFPLPTASFDSVSIKGDLVLHINSRPNPASSLTIEGDSTVISQIKPSIVNRTLYLDLSTIASNNSIQANLNCGPLKSLSYVGNNHGILEGTIVSNELNLSLKNLHHVMLSGKNIALQQLNLSQINNVQLAGLNTTKLSATVSDVMNTDLAGNIGLQELKQTGIGNFAALWVNSKKLTLQSDKQAHIYLAGKIDFVDALLQNNSQLQAQFVRAKKVFVHTEGNSRAHIGKTAILNAYASDSSAIYYTEIPTYLSRYTQAEGAVLLLQKQPPLCTADYCKQLPILAR